MGKVTEVPITPQVLDWAITESGLSDVEVANAAGVEPEDLDAWRHGAGRPGVTAVRSLAQVLRRPVAAFLLPKAPTSEHPEVRFRHLPGAPARELSHTERRYVRKALRLQRMIAWVCQELALRAPRLPRATLGDAPTPVADQIREQLGVSIDAQLGWPSASVAFDAWRESVEGLDVAVFLFALGSESCRGFSLWHERAPTLAVNTAWNDEARIFTLLHELGHLVTRTNSACTAGPPASLTHAWDPTERWCERFAAAVLIPEAKLRGLLRQRLGSENARVAEVAHVRWLANRFKASLRAVTVRLIELGVASWDLYRALPETGDAKRGGGGGKGRDRQEIQEDSLGGRATDLFRRAVEADVLTRSQALTFLDVPDQAFDARDARTA